MSGNPYIATHFGSSMDLVRNGRLSDDKSDELDASIGFSRFPSSKHMTASVFKPSKPWAASSPQPVAIHTPPDSVLKLRNRLLMSKFPSHPATPDPFPLSNHHHSHNHNNNNHSTLPPLCPPSSPETSGWIMESRNGVPAEGSTTSSIPTNDLQGIHNGNDNDEEAGSVNDLKRAQRADVEADKGGDVLCTAASDPQLCGGSEATLGSRHWISRSSRPSKSSSPVLKNASTDAASRECNGVNAHRIVGSSESAPAAPLVSSDPEAACVTPPGASAAVPPPPSSSGASDSAGNNQVAVERIGSRGPHPVAELSGGGGGGGGVAERRGAEAAPAAAEGAFQRSRAVLSYVQRLLDTACPPRADAEGAPQKKSPRAEDGVALDGDAVSPLDSLPPYSEPPTLPEAKGFSAVGGEEPNVLLTETAWSGSPISVSPASEMCTHEYSRVASSPCQRASARNSWTVACGTTGAALPPPPESDTERQVVATLCAAPSRQADRSLMRRGAAYPYAAAQHGPEAREVPLFQSHLAEELDDLVPARSRPRATSSRQRSSGRFIRRSSSRSSSSSSSGSSGGGRGRHPRRRHGSSRADGRQAHGKHGSDSTSTDLLEELLAQLTGFLHDEGRASSKRLGAPRPYTAGRGARPDGVDRATTAPAAAAQSEERGASSSHQESQPVPLTAGATRVSRLTSSKPAIAPPTVLAGHHPAQIRLLSRRAPSQSRSANRGQAPPRYALPTESWLQKNIEDDGERWFA